MMGGQISAVILSLLPGSNQLQLRIEFCLKLGIKLSVVLENIQSDNLL